jgi:hypothetical protein
MSAARTAEVSARNSVVLVVGPMIGCGVSAWGS